MLKLTPRIVQPSLIYGGSAPARATLLADALTELPGDWLVLDGQGDACLADQLLAMGVGVTCRDFTPPDLFGGGAEKPAHAVYTGKDYWSVATEDAEICLGVQRRLSSLPTGVTLILLDPPKALQPVLRNLLRSTRVVWAGPNATQLHNAVGPLAQAATQAVFFRVADIATMEALARWGNVHLPTAANMAAFDCLVAEPHQPTRAMRLSPVQPAMTGTYPR